MPSELQQHTQPTRLLRTYSVLKGVASSLVVLVLCGFGSCSPRLSDLCQHPVEEPYLNARIALQPWSDVPEGPSRGLASELKPSQDGPSASVSLASLDRDYWTKWSMDRLAEVQAMIDLTYGDTSLRDLHNELSTVADQVVAFYGYTHQGRPRQMMVVLQRIEARGEKIHALACH